VTQQLSTHGIGASEIAAICGLNPFAGPWGIWLRKTGQVPDVEANPNIEWGHRLEPAIRQAYADKTGATMHVPPESMFHHQHSWARATPDAIAVSAPQERYPLGIWQHLVQAKNVGYWVGKDWGDAPPVYVQLQEQWEMAVTALPRADVAALIAGFDFRIYTVHRDDTMIADLLTIAEDFWRKVQARTPPKVDASEACRDHFTRRLQLVQPVELVADAEIESLVGNWKTTRDARKQAERDVEKMRNQVRATMDAAQCNRIVSRLGMIKLDSTGKLLEPREWSKENNR
jgi:putative phage-type endonuclease